MDSPATLTSLSLPGSRVADPALFMHDCGYRPDPWQAQVLRNSSDRIALLCPRQTGKSQVTAVKALHHALIRSKALVLLVSRSQDQSDNLFRKIIECYNACGRPVPPIRERASSIMFENLSEIVALPNNPRTIRSWSSCTLLIIDEAAQVEPAIITAVLPMILATSGDVCMLSTPFGQTGFFYDEFANPNARWDRFRVRIEDCPRFDPAIVAELRRILGPLAPQELDCEFLRSPYQVFPIDSINNAFNPHVITLPGF